MPETVWKIHSENCMPAVNVIEPKIALVLLAAGRGERAGGDLPKQFQSLLGKPVVVHTIERLIRAFDGLGQLMIQPVIGTSGDEIWQRSTESLARPVAEVIANPVSGGATRQESVLNGLRALAKNPPDYVFIHDAARPFVTSAMVTHLMHALYDGAVGAIPALPISDTIVRVDEGKAVSINRDGLYSVQTPQAFPFGPIFEAHEAMRGQEFTDDASVLRAAGEKCAYTSGAEGNFKITNPSDFERAERHIMQELNDIRTATGFDVHRFEDGDHVTLCGVKIPFQQRLKGHSDADVAMHALTDAILAALTDGDIGAHFPPSDEQWRGADSSVFLKFAADKVRERRGAIAHVAVTIICEAPKIRPHVEAMRSRLADLLYIERSRVSIQATTTEMLGFTGRREGIAAQASATVRLPMDLDS